MPSDWWGSLLRGIVGALCAFPHGMHFRMCCELGPGLVLVYVLSLHSRVEAYEDFTNFCAVLVRMDHDSQSKLSLVGKYTG